MCPLIALTEAAAACRSLQCMEIDNPATAHRPRDDLAIQPYVDDFEAQIREYLEDETNRNVGESQSLPGYRF
jgi:hypothetical protein